MIRVSILYLGDRWVIVVAYGGAGDGILICFFDRNSRESTTFFANLYVTCFRYRGFLLLSFKSINFRILKYLTIWLIL